MAMLRSSIWRRLAAPAPAPRVASFSAEATESGPWATGAHFAATAAAAVAAVSCLAMVPEEGSAVVPFAYADSGVGVGVAGVGDGEVSVAASELRQEKREFQIFRDSFRRKVFFNYEKRMRMRSPPEKIFEYFASVRKPEGEAYMLPADFMRAIVPVFPPSESNAVRDGSLRGERHPGELNCAPSEFFMLFDTNNDGLISYSEYIFFMTLLSIPESSFSVAFKMFDLDHNGEIDREEFKKVMLLLRSQNRRGASYRNGIRYEQKVGESVENGGLVEYFFGKDGKGLLHYDKFVKFLRDLHDEIIHLEFSHYDFKSTKTISARDFALSMVASADSEHLNRLLGKVSDLSNKAHLKDVRITFEEFKAFADLRRTLEPFSMAFFSYGKMNGLLTKQDLKRAAFHVCGISLTDNVVDVIFHVFDSNRDGDLSVDEFVRSLHTRENNIHQPPATGFLGLLCCWMNCTKCSSLPHMLL